jgi:hypothetical protein
MDSDLLEALLNEDESSTLDFKRDQYLFEGASKEQKSELLKDILAFSNAWRRTNAYILTGVEEVQGGRNIIIGVTDHLSESDLQQFVNSKTNRPVIFSYRGFPFEGKQIGVIDIPLQERPIFLKKDYGKLKKGTVYIRRGGSTAIASPDEVAKMGATVATGEIPILDLQFADVETYTELGRNIQLESVLLDLPDESQIPMIETNTLISSVVSVNASYYRDFARYLFWASALKPIGFVLRNTGSTLAVNARLEIAKLQEEGFLFVGISDYPSRPKYRKSIADLADLPTGLFGDHVTVAERGNKWHILAELGSVQPKAAVWSGIFYVGSRKPDPIELEAVVYADNLPDPLKVSLTITIIAKKQSISMEELKEIADENRR